MERQRNNSDSETEEGDSPVNEVHHNLMSPRPNSPTRTSSEDDFDEVPEPEPLTTDERSWDSVAPWFVPPRRVRQHRPWSSRDRYFSSPYIMNQQLPLYYRQYLRQEVLRSYMSPVQRMPLTTHTFPRNLPTAFHQATVRRAYVTPQNVRQGYSESSNESNTTRSNSSQSTTLTSNGLSGMAICDIQNNTRLLLKKDETEDDMTCVICLSLITKLQLIRKLPCRHAFHKQCIDKWLGFNGICPTCRYDVRLRRQSTPSSPH